MMIRSRTAAICDPLERAAPALKHLETQTEGEFNRGAKRMPELGKAIVFFAAFCAVMGWAAIELLIWLFSSIGFVWLG